VGTSHFGEVSARPEKNKEEEKAILERIRKMNTVVPKEPAHTAQTVSANQPMGKLTFSAPQVFASENSRPQTPPPATTPMAPTVRLEPVATSSQTITIAKPAAPIVSHQTVTTSLPSKLVVTPQEVKKPHPDRSMFHIKPNRDE
jgi:hypothetical protein